MKAWLLGVKKKYTQEFSSWFEVVKERYYTFDNRIKLNNVVTSVIMLSAILMIELFLSVLPLNIFTAYMGVVTLGMITYYLNNSISYYLYMLHAYFLLFLMTTNLYMIYGNADSIYLIILGLIVAFLYRALHYKYMYTNKIDSKINYMLASLKVPSYVLIIMYVVTPNAFNKLALTAVNLIIIGLYFGESLVFLNIKAREQYLMDKLETTSLRNLIPDYGKRLESTSIKKANQDLLLYYFMNALQNFLESDFEQCFMNSYKIVFDSFSKYQTVASSGDRSHYREKRDSLAHTKISQAFKNKEELEKLKKDIFDDAIKLLVITKKEYFDVLLS